MSRIEFGYCSQNSHIVTNEGRNVKELRHAIHHVREFKKHPFGFSYFQNKIGRGIYTRVHVWFEPVEDRPPNDSHQHSYVLESKVVLGQLANELFRFQDSKKGSVLEFAVSYEYGEATLRSTGRSGLLAPIASFVTSCGGQYRLEAGVIHRVSMEVIPSVTVVTTIERGMPVFAYGPGDVERPFLRRIVDSAEAARIESVIGDAICRASVLNT